jgi:two-component system, chemotaxis family, CheB/CheR fusion protein
MAERPVTPSRPDAGGAIRSGSSASSATDDVPDSAVVSGDESFPVVGIGASAGGLEAFAALLSALPSDTGMAFVVVSHLDPTHVSALPEILARATTMPTVEAVNDQPVQPDHVYVMPPGKDMTIDEGRLQLQPRPSHALHRPVDLFFRSLADDRRHQAIGVILSGTASDGTLGTRAIKGASGITFAQDDSAQQSGMPESAVADGCVDFVLPPAAIAAELVRISRLPRAESPSSLTVDEEDACLADVLNVVRNETGVDFTHYKAPTLRRRILRRMILEKQDSLRGYAQLLHDRPSEAHALHDDLLIGVTSFFRDPESFDALAQKAFPALLERRRASEPIRVWVLGCSTGEEAYSLAMALTEFLDAARVDVPLQVFASDVNARGIELARAAVYGGDIVQDVSPERLRRFFVPSDDGQYRIAKRIRDVCIFSRHNVLIDPPFSRIDLVSCRNLLIYLEPVLQHDVVRNLHYALTPEGLLWLGNADAVGSQQDLFDPVDAAHKIFRRRAGTVSHPTLGRGLVRWHATAPPAERHDVVRAVDVLKESDRVLLSRFAPAGILVSPGFEVLQYRGHVAPYIAPAAGKPSTNLMQVLDRRLQVAVRAALARSGEGDGTISEEQVRLAGDGGVERQVSIQVVQVGAGPQGFLILFSEQPAAGVAGLPAGESTHDHTAERDDQQLARVSKELADTQAYLQSLIEDRQTVHEDLESAHEEAQSANEELQSINEELETSKEEIQSANEELTTLNEELQHRNTELLRANSDLMNVLGSTHLAVVFVGLDRSIRSFTPAAATLLHLRTADIGRPLRDLRLNNMVDLDAPIAHTIDTLELFEQNVQDEDGRWLSIRIRPYRTIDNQIDGAVVVCVDIDVLVRGRLFAESIIATVPSPLVVMDERFIVATANAAFYRMFHTVERDTEGRSFFEIGNRAFDRPELRALLHDVLPENQSVVDFSVNAVRPGSQPEVSLVSATRLVNAEDGRPLILLSIEDVTERQHAETLRQQRVAELAAADQHKNEFLAMLAHELRNPLAPIRTAAQLLGASGVPAGVSEHARVIIERQIGIMTRLIDDLLDVARITQGKIDLRLVPLDLVAVVRQAAEGVQPQVAERAQQLLVSLPAGPLFVLGDATRLEQALGNVLTNASKFSHRHGRIWLRLETTVSPQGEDALVSVRDEGIGISADTLPYVFELFKQGGPSPHRTPGLGVGLALVRRIVELHGGDVQARSAGRDRGCELELRVPLLQAADHVPVAAGPSAPRAATILQRILVVDDNADAAESLTALLRVWGHDVQVVHDGAAALDVAAVFVPSIVVLDIGMPGMDGYDVARRLRRMPGLEHALLIALTGFGGDQDRERAKQAGFDRHITKPVDPAVLQTVIASRAQGSTDGG